MNHKLILIASVVFMLCSKSNAQSEFRIGLKGGVNLSTIKSGSDNNSVILADYNNWLLSYHVGAVVDIGISRDAFIRTGLDWQGRGTKYENALDKNGRLHPMFLELPVNMAMRKDVGKTSLYIGVGPYVAYGISGKNKYSVLNENAPVTSTKIQWGNEAPITVRPGNSGYLRRLAFGANAIGGIEFLSKYAINLQYGYGLNNARPEGSKGRHINAGAGIILFL